MMKKSILPAALAVLAFMLPGSSAVAQNNNAEVITTPAPTAPATIPNPDRRDEQNEYGCDTGEAQEGQQQNCHHHHHHHPPHPPNPPSSPNPESPPN